MTTRTNFSRSVNLLLFVAICFISLTCSADDQNYFKFDTVEPLEPALKQNLKAFERDVILIDSNWDQKTIYTVSDNKLFQSSIQDLSTPPSVIADLPAGIAPQTITLSNHKIYALVQAEQASIVSIDLLAEVPNWETVSAVEFEANEQSAFVVVSNAVYVAGRSRLHAYDLSQNKWHQYAEMPASFSYNVVFPVGNAHILFIDKDQAQGSVFAYHLITDSWVNIEMNLGTDDILAASSSGNVFTLLSENFVLQGEAVLSSTNYSNLDHAVVLILVGLLIGVGYFFSRKEKTSADYFKADSKIPWWAASLSIFATNSSAITLMAMPSMAFSSNWIYFSITIFLVCIQIPLFVYVFVPIVRRLNMATANQYLEHRFGVSVRMLGFIGFSFNQILGRMAAILLLPATAISAIFGIPMEYSILIMGVSATIFVTMGGLAAVIWTDVIQAFIMIIAVFICAYFALSALEFPISMTTEILVDREKLKMFDFRLDLAAPVVIVLFLNAVATSLTYIGDQNFVQRVQCTSSEKEANKAVVSQLFVAMPLNLILFSLGSVLFLYYLSRPEQLPPALTSDGILPYFAAQTLPAGLAGIVVVALLAATISTVSSAMNSVANLGVDDIYRRFNPNVSDKAAVNLGRYLTIGLGIFGTLAALALANMSSLKSLWDLFLMITGMLLSPITGIFILGVFTKRANIIGAWAGTIASIFVNYYAMFHMNVHALVYLVAGVTSCVIVGYVASVIYKKESPDLKGLTIYTLLKRV